MEKWFNIVCLTFIGIGIVWVTYMAITTGDRQAVLFVAAFIIALVIVILIILVDIIMAIIRGPK